MWAVPCLLEGFVCKFGSTCGKFDDFYREKNLQAQEKIDFITTHCELNSENWKKFDFVENFPYIHESNYIWKIRVLCLQNYFEKWYVKRQIWYIAWKYTQHYTFHAKLPSERKLSTFTKRHMSKCNSTHVNPFTHPKPPIIIVKLNKINYLSMTLLENSR